MFSRSFVAQWVGMGFERKVFRAAILKSLIHGASFLTEEMKSIVRSDSPVPASKSYWTSYWKLPTAWSIPETGFSWAASTVSVWGLCDMGGSVWWVRR